MEHGGGGTSTPAKAGANPRKPYKKRTPKPRFIPPNEKRKAKAIKQVEADRREAAAAEAERRKGRKTDSPKGSLSATEGPSR